MKWILVPLAIGCAAVVVLLLWRVLRSRVVASMAFALAKNSDSEIRRAAVNQLGRLAHRRYPNAFEALDRASQDPDESVSRTASRMRNAVAESCGGFPLTPLPDQGRLDAFKSQLLADDPAQRRAAADALRTLGDPWMYQAAVQVRRDLDTSDVEAKRRAVLALGDLGDPLSADKLLFALMEETDPIVRRGAAVAAGQVGAWRCLGILMTIARTDPDHTVRWGASTGLGRLASLGIGDRAGVHAVLATLAERESDLKAKAAAREAAEAWRSPSVAFD